MIKPARSKMIPVLTLIAALFICTACGYRFADQNVAIEGWSYADKKPEVFDLGNFEVAFLANGEEGQVSFRVKDRNSFLQSILDHPGFVRQEYNAKQNKVYVLRDSGGCYLLVETESKNKQSEYFLRPAVSRYFDADGTTYEFPLYDFSVRYDGQVFFHQDQNTVKTQNDWQYFMDGFAVLPRDCIAIDQSEKSVLISVTKLVNGKQIIDDTRKIKIVYRSDESDENVESAEHGNYLVARLIALTEN